MAAYKWNDIVLYWVKEALDSLWGVMTASGSSHFDYPLVFPGKLDSYDDYFGISSFVINFKSINNYSRYTFIFTDNFHVPYTHRFVQKYFFRSHNQNFNISAGFFRGEMLGMKRK